MGFFTKREPCPICGGKVKGLLPQKIGGRSICGDCSGFIDLPDGVAEEMSIDEFRGYMAFREENGKLKECFETVKQIDFGIFDTKFMFDMNNRLLCMDQHLNKTIFKAAEIESFVIREDTTLLFEGNAHLLKRYISTVPKDAAALTPQITQYILQRRMLERVDDDNSMRHRLRRIPAPFENFYVDIHFKHPYWDIFTADMSGPQFDDVVPDVNDYLREYKSSAAVMEDLAFTLMELAFPGAPDQIIDPYAPVSAQPVSAPADALEEIRRCKTLLDDGIITEEEFAAKKRQLLGI